MAKAKTIGVIGIKGGVGKTSVAANLGASLANDLKKRVLVIDANFSTPHLGYHLGLIRPQATLQQVLHGEEELAKALYKHRSGLHVIPGGLHKKPVSPQKLKGLVSPLKAHYDFIIIDSSPTLNEEIIAAMDNADEAIIVASPDYPTLSSTFHALKLAEKKKTKLRGIVVNKVRKKSYEPSPQEISEVTQSRVLALIPEDEKVVEALAFTTPVVVHSPQSPAAKELKRLAASFVNEPLVKKPLVVKLPPKPKKSATKPALKPKVKKSTKKAKWQKR